MNKSKQGKDFNLLVPAFGHNIPPAIASTRMIAYKKENVVLMCNLQGINMHTKQQNNVKLWLM